MTVVTMKMVASTAREAMAMRQVFTTPRVEQGWTSVLGAVEDVGVDLVVGVGNHLGP